MKKFVLMSAAVAATLSAVAIDKAEVSAISVPAQSVISHRYSVENKAEVKDAKVLSQSALSPNVFMNKKGLISKKGSIRPLADDVVAGYVAPTMFYSGFSENNYWLSKDGQIGLTVYNGPAYTDQTWLNYSTGATQYTWTYDDPDATSVDDPQLTSTEKDLTVSYGLGQYNVPVLTASNGTTTDEYSYGYFMQQGASQAIFEQLLGYEDIEDYGATMFDYGASYFLDLYFEAMMRDEDMMGQGLREDIEAEGYTNAKYENFGVIYYKPAATYSISKLWLRTYAPNMPAGTEIVADIYELGDDGEYLIIPEEPVAHARFEAQTNMSSESSYTTLVFNVYYDDPVTGLEVEGPLNVSSDLMITFPALTNDDKYEYYPMFTTVPRDYMSYVSRPNVCGVSYDTPDGGRGMYYMSFPWILSTEDGSSFGMETYELMTDATFGWFIPESDRIADVDGYNVLTAATEGETVTIPVNSLYLAENTTSISVWSEDGDTDWVSCTVTDEADQTGSNINLTVEALPSGVTGRKCTITFTPQAADPYKLTIGQGTVGVESAVVTSAARVSVVGGNFVVNAPETINAVTVYNVAGQAVATSEVAGSTTVDASSLAKGVYVLRFNDGSTVKVIK